MAPSDYHLISALKDHLNSKRLQSDNNMHTHVIQSCQLQVTESEKLVLRSVISQRAASFSHKTECVLFLLELEINSLEYMTSKLIIVWPPLAHCVSVMFTAGVQDYDHDKITLDYVYVCHSEMYLTLLFCRHCHAWASYKHQRTCILAAVNISLLDNPVLLPHISLYSFYWKFTAFRKLYFLLPISLSLVRITLTRRWLLSHYSYHSKHQDCQYFI